MGVGGKTHGFARAQQQAALRQIRTNNNRLSFDANMVIVGREATQKDLKALGVDAVGRFLNRIGLTKTTFELRQSARNGLQLRVNTDNTLSRRFGLPIRSRVTFSQTASGDWVRATGDIGLNWTPNRTRGRSTSGRSESSLSGFAGIPFTGQGVNIVASGSATITSPARTRHGGGVAGNYRLFNYSAPTPDNRTQRSNSLAPSRHSNFMATLPRRPLSAQERAASMREITNYLNSVR